MKASTAPGPAVVVVTGASSGIGRATAHHAATRGDHVVLVARGRDALEDAARECDAAGAASTLVIPTDVGDDGEVCRLVEAVLARHGRIDVFVNSAGVVAYGRTEDVPVEVFDGVLRTNLHGSVNVARHVLPVLRGQGGGALVLVGSVIGHISVPTMSAYVLSKWGVRALARQLRLENRDLPAVRIIYVAPGGVDTPIYAQAANVVGFEGRPPPPVSSSARAARQILRRVRHHGYPAQLSVTNELIRFGHTALPWVYDAIVGPLFTVAATDLTRPVEPNPGNVLEPHEEANSTHGDQGNALVGIVRNLRAALAHRRPARPLRPTPTNRTQ